jgi:hypothetical protein
MDKVGAVLAAANSTLDTAKATLGVLDQGNDVIDRFTGSTLVRAAGSFAKQKIENDVRTMVQSVNWGLKVVAASVVVILLVIIVQLFLRIENPEAATKMGAFLSMLTVALLGGVLAGMWILHSGIEVGAKALFGDQGSIYLPVRELSR